MNDTSTVPAAIETLAVPGAQLHYELRGIGPLVVLVGAPMDATSFAPLADLLASDYTVLTTDPRGVNRSSVDNRDDASTPELRADDLARIIGHVDAGPARVFGSSGGAVTALALAQNHPDLVDTVIAHEPPLIALLDDRAQLRAGAEDIRATFLAGDRTGAWRKFMAQANIAMPDDVFEMMFGSERAPQEAADERFWFTHEFRPSTFWQPDIATLRAAAARILVGVGSDSGGQLCDRTSTALAASLGSEVTTFPGGHIGFVENPDEFAPRLREVLRGN